MLEEYEEKVMDGKLWIRTNPESGWKAASYDLILGRMLLAERNLNRLIEEHQKTKASIR